MRIGDQWAKGDSREESKLVRRLYLGRIRLLCRQAGCENSHDEKRRDKSLVWLLLLTHLNFGRRYVQWLSRQRQYTKTLRSDGTSARRYRRKAIGFFAVCLTMRLRASIFF
jgi:hypothetical protein